MAADGARGRRGAGHRVCALSLTVVVIVVVTVDTSGYVTNLWLLSAVDHVHNSLDHWFLVHGVDNWCLRHYVCHWLLVDGMCVCALVDCPGGCLAVMVCTTAAQISL